MNVNNINHSLHDDIDISNILSDIEIDGKNNYKSRPNSNTSLSPRGLSNNGNHVIKNLNLQDVETMNNDNKHEDKITDNQFVSTIERNSSNFYNADSKKFSFSKDH